MSWWQQGAASTRPAPHPTARANASSVAVSQACSASTTSGGCGRVASPIVPTTKSASMPSEAATAGVVVGRLLLHVDPGDPHRQRPLVGEEALGGEGEVGVAAAEVDDPQRVGLGRRAQVALGQRVGDRGVQQPEELLDLAVLRLPRRLDPALGVGDAERDQHRVVLGEQPLLVPVVATVGGERARRGPGCATIASSFLVTRSWWVWVVVSTCQLPKGSARSASTAASASAPTAKLAVCACVSSYDVTCRWRPALRST